MSKMTVAELIEALKDKDADVENPHAAAFIKI